MRAAIQCITNSDLSDSQWLQASLQASQGWRPGGETCYFACINSTQLNRELRTQVSDTSKCAS